MKRISGVVIAIVLAAVVSSFVIPSGASNASGVEGPSSGGKAEHRSWRRWRDFGGPSTPHPSDAPLGMTKKVAAVHVTRKTLKNGLQVVVLSDPLAPVVSMMMNYMIGADDEPITGLAHAQEHMMFRGSKTVSAGQFAEVTALTGGSYDADTQNEVTQFFFTVPSQDLDMALHLEASRAQGILDTDKLWSEERGAIEQEVQQDNSNVVYRLYVKMLRNVLGGTPYQDPGLGTMQSFSHQVNGKQLQAFYSKWYHPNNAILVIAGDVDPATAIAKVDKLFGTIPAKRLPQRRSVRLAPVHRATFSDFGSNPQIQALVGYRFPGYQSPDYAATQILLDVLNSKRANLYKLVADGKAFDAGAFGQTYPMAGIAIVELDVAPTNTPQSALAQLQNVIAGYRKNGVPADLIAAAKLREAAQEQFSANSISGLAQEWSQALAVEHRTPDEDLAAIERVTPADVNRVLRTYMSASATKAYAVPKNTGAVGSGSPGRAPENNTIVPTKQEPLPTWAEQLLHGLRAPEETAHPVESVLPNGMHLIVQPEPFTHTIVLRGAIKTAPNIEEKSGQDGVASLAGTLLDYGTTTYDRLAYQRELDKIAADVSTGSSFGLDVTTQNFDRGVQLLADAELHPALRAKDFQIAKHQELEEVQSEEKSPDHLTRLSLVSALYPKDDPLQRHPTPQTVQTLTLDDVHTWYETAYRPDLATIVIIGDVKPDDARRVIEKWFGDWQAHGAKPDLYPSPVPDNARASITVPATGRVQDTVILSQTLRLKRLDTDVPALRVANAALSGGFYASILFRDLRETTGYVYSVNSNFDLGKTRSTFNIVYGASPQNVAKADGVVVADLRRLQTQALSANRLLVAKALLLGEVATHGESYSGLAGGFLSDALDELPLDEDIREARAELAATPQQVQAAMARWIRPDGFAEVIEGPSPP